MHAELSSKVCTSCLQPAAGSVHLHRIRVEDKQARWMTGGWLHKLDERKLTGEPVATISGELASAQGRRGHCTSP